MDSARPAWRSPRALRFAAAAGVGSALAIGLMEGLSLSMRFPLAAVPFATSIVLVISMPDARPSQPRALIGGHLVATLIGLLVVKLAGPQGWAAALAVGLSTFAMILTDTVHPPAGINPLLVVVNNLSWPFFFVPVLAGVLLLLAFAWIWHRAIRRDVWPRDWL